MRRRNTSAIAGCSISMGAPAVARCSSASAGASSASTRSSVPPFAARQVKLTWDDVDYRKSDRPTEGERAKTARADQQHGIPDDYVQPTPARP